MGIWFFIIVLIIFKIQTATVSICLVKELIHKTIRDALDKKILIPKMEEKVIMPTNNISYVNDKIEYKTFKSEKEEPVEKEKYEEMTLDLGMIKEETEA